MSSARAPAERAKSAAQASTRSSLGVSSSAPWKAVIAACAAQGWATLWLPLLVVAAFAQYSLDSKALAGAKLRANWLGRTNGIAYFVLVGVCIGFALLGLPQWLPLLLSWLLSATTLISMFNRGQYWWRHRTSS